LFWPTMQVLQAAFRVTMDEQLHLYSYFRQTSG